MTDERVVDPETGEVQEASALPFAAWLQDYRKGLAHAELTEKFPELIEAVTRHKKKGTLTFRITVEPFDESDYQVTVTDEVIVKPPEGRRPQSIFYVDRQNNLTRDDPYRMQFEQLREVPPHEAPDLKDAR